MVYLTPSYVIDNGNSNKVEKAEREVCPLDSDTIISSITEVTCWCALWIAAPKTTLSLGTSTDTDFSRMIPSNQLVSIVLSLNSEVSNNLIK